MALPLMISLLYIDHKPLNLFFGFNIALLIVFYIINAKKYEALVGVHFSGIVCMSFVVFLLFYFLARLILRQTVKLVEESVYKDQKLARDSFTGLLNHAAFYTNLDQLILENKRQGTIFSLIVWDIDNFKSINDKFGHEIGDRVLTSFIRALKDFADEDADLCFRYGGEEFAVLTRNDVNAAHTLSCKVRERFTQYSVTMPMLGRLMTASAGICEYSNKFGGSREFFSAADRALYAAKKVPGKDTSTVWTDEMFEQSAIRQHLKRSMFKNQDFETEEPPLENKEPPLENKDPS